jgi:hypothetical protein
MERQQALQLIWKRLLIVLAAFILIVAFATYFAGDMRVPLLVFVIGNIGGYVTIHRSLNDLTDAEVVGLSGSWLGIVVPSFVGGILGLVLYLLFLSKLVGGDIFPKFAPDAGARVGFEGLFDQHGEQMADYAKLFFWSFIAGFNQGYVVDIINSVRSK